MIDHSVYVRISPLDVSNRWSAKDPRLDKPSKISSHARRHHARPAQICDTCKAAPGGLLCRHLTGATEVTRRGPSCCWRVENCRVIYQVLDDLGMQPRLHYTRRSQSPPYCSNTRGLRRLPQPNPAQPHWCKLLRLNALCDPAQQLCPDAHRKSLIKSDELFLFDFRRERLFRCRTRNPKKKIRSDQIFQT